MLKFSQKEKIPEIFLKENGDGIFGQIHHLSKWNPQN